MKDPALKSKSARHAIIGATCAILLFAPTFSHSFGLSDVLQGLGKVTNTATDTLSGGNKTFKSALEGGALGAIAGQAIGRDEKSTWIGAGIGAATSMVLDASGTQQPAKQRKLTRPEQARQDRLARDQEAREARSHANERTTAHSKTTRKYENGKLVSTSTTEVINRRGTYDDYNAEPGMARLSRPQTR